MNHLHLPFFSWECWAGSSRASASVGGGGAARDQLGSGGGFDLLSYKQNVPSTPGLVWVTPGVLFGSLLSCNFASSAIEFIMLALLSALNVQLFFFLDE